MKEPIKYEFTLDDFEQLDNIVRLRLIEAIEDMELYGEEDEDAINALLKVIAMFSTKDQWAQYVANKVVSYDTK